MIVHGHWYSMTCLLMLINIIHKGSMPDSSSTTYPMGASCFRLLWKNILSAMYVDWGPPHLSLVVYYIFHLLNTWHVESSYILQPPKYLLLFVNLFKYINNNVTKDSCSIPMDTTVWLGPLNFSLRATRDHHEPSVHSGHYIASINCYKNNLLQQ